MIGWLQTHLRNKFLAGLLAAGPVAVLIWGAVWLEQHTRPLTEPLGTHFPGLGVLIALLAVYLLGLVVTSLFGRLVLRAGDRVLQRVPGFSLVYRAWKEILVVPPDRAGMFHEVVLLPCEAGSAVQLGFTSGVALPADPESICVFLPNVPNPLSGRLVLVKRAECLPLGISVEEAIKFLLSSGNHLPAKLGSGT